MLELKDIAIDRLNSQDTINIDEISSDHIAIIGMSVKMPLADNTDEFWNNIRNLVDCVRTIPEERKLDINRYIEYMNFDKERIRFPELAYLHEIDKFDYAFFNMSPNEANFMDPNQRIFLETVWKAIEDAGYGGDQLIGSRTGVYLGYGDDANYKKIISETDPDSLSISLIGNLRPVIASRISYLLDLRGPSFIVDTTCSSSLVAVHLACQAIKFGECNIAIAGGIKTYILPLLHGNQVKIGIESSDGRTHAFDESADGTGGGEGCAAILLKPLSKALEDNDNIYAVIKGSAINQDGNSNGITAPNAFAQEDVINRAWKNAGIAADSVSYIEAHGTGTKLGDPIEVEGMQRAFKRYTNKRNICAISSIKTNIGHLDNAAGIAGLVKAVLALKNKELPASLHYKKSNTNIDFENSAVYVNDTLKPWDNVLLPRRCGVSAFGLSGTNCHMVLEEAPVSMLKSCSSMNNLFLLSAKSIGSLKALINSYIKFIGKNKYCSMTDICYTAAIGRGHYNYRLAIITQSLEDLLHKLISAKAIEVDSYKMSDGVFFGLHKVVNNVKVAKKGKEVTEEEINILNRKAVQKLLQISHSNIDYNLLSEICVLYIKGSRINWNDYYKYKKFNKISLPTYPFENTRCWISIPKDNGLEKPQNNNIQRVRETPECSHNNEEKIKEDNCVAENVVKIVGRDSVKYSQNEIKVGQAWGAVLGFDEINIDDDFFELGGNSILAIKIANIINKTLNIDINVSDILIYQSVREFCAFLDENFDFTENNRKYSAIYCCEKKECYATSSAQKRLYIINNLNNNDLSYNMPAAMFIEGNIDLVLIKDVLNELVMRHEILRTSFYEIDGEPVQKIHDTIDLELEYVDIDENEIKKELIDFIRPFDLLEPPLWRVKFGRISSEKHLLMFDMHHIISDGTSAGILVKEFADLYNGIRLPTLKIQYKDFAEWQNSLLGIDFFKHQEEYWLNTFEKGNQVLYLPSDFPRPFIQSHDGSHTSFKADSNLTSQLNRISRNENSTLYMVLLSAYYILLAKYSGQEDITIGTPVSGRQHLDLESIIGLFVNTIALRNYPEKNKTYKEFLSDVKNNVLKAYENEDYPFDMLIDKLKISRDISRNPLFDIMFTMQNMGIAEINTNTLRYTYYYFDNKTSKFDMELEAVEKGGEILFNLEYCTSLFKTETIDRITIDYLCILRSIALDINLEIKDIELGSCSNIESDNIDDNITFNFM